MLKKLQHTKKNLTSFAKKKKEKHAVMLTHSEGLIRNKLQRKYRKNNRRIRKWR